MLEDMFFKSHLDEFFLLSCITGCELTVFAFELNTQFAFAQGHFSQKIVNKLH